MQVMQILIVYEISYKRLKLNIEFLEEQTLTLSQLQGCCLK